MHWINLWLLAYLALGLVSGFLAGLLGIGGGLIIVAVLTMAFDAQAMSPALVLPLALGTAMATIIFTSIASFKTHHAHGAVRWDLVRDITPGVVLGALLGTLIAAHAPLRALTLFFACFMLLVAVQMAAGLKPSPGRTLPARAGRLAGGGVIGVVSALVAIGGGTLTVPWLSWCNVRIQHAIGTSAAMGLPIALSGTAGYLWNGWGRDGLPAGSLGYVYLPALLCLLLTSMLAAPFGARLAHQLPVATLKKAFALLLVLLSAKMFLRAFQLA